CSAPGRWGLSKSRAQGTKIQRPRFASRKSIIRWADDHFHPLMVPRQRHGGLINNKQSEIKRCQPQRKNRIACTSTCCNTSEAHWAIILVRTMALWWRRGESIPRKYLINRGPRNRPSPNILYRIRAYSKTIISK